MPKISRRAARARGGKDVPADAKLLELEKQLEAARQIPVETDEEVDEKADIQLGLEGQIATGAAEGLTGIAVKLRLALSLFKEANYGSPTEVICTKTALEAVDRLLKGGETGDDAEVLKAHEEWRRLEEAADKTERQVDYPLPPTRRNASWKPRRARLGVCYSNSGSAVSRRFTSSNTRPRTACRLPLRRCGPLLPTSSGWRGGRDHD